MLQMVGRLLIVELVLLRMVDMMGGGLLVGLLLLVGGGLRLRLLMGGLLKRLK
jgi:hypothetical protein